MHFSLFCVTCSFFIFTSLHNNKKEEQLFKYGVIIALYSRHVFLRFKLFPIIKNPCFLFMCLNVCQIQTDHISVFTLYLSNAIRVSWCPGN